MPASTAVNNSLLVRGFATTHWTMVRAASGNTGARREAREALCRDYWYPIYAYLRRLGHRNDAEDITQDFLTDILRRNWLAQADPNRGKFRAFLLSSLDNFLHNLVDRRKALKRGGAYLHVPLDMGDAQSRYGSGRMASVPPAEVYELEWALAIVTASITRLEAQYAAAGEEDHFGLFKIFLKQVGDNEQYRALAAELGSPLSTIKSYVHRLRQRYAAILREEVARTVPSLGDVEEEMQYLRATLAVRQPARQPLFTHQP